MSLPKYFEKRIEYTDGFQDATLVCLRNGYYFGCVVEWRYKGRVCAVYDFTVREYGSYKRAREEALKHLKNNHAKKVEIKSQTPGNLGEEKECVLKKMTSQVLRNV